ncbi:hypothetical protein ACET3Z_025081 [Daucus carota]
MEFTWEVPDKGFYKINVHVESLFDPILNRNVMSVGVIIRDEWGVKLWGALGVVNALNEEQALMAGIQAACIRALKMKLRCIHIETTSQNVYDTLSVQESIILPDELAEAYELFNTVHANNFVEGKSVRRVACIPARMNSTAQYMAHFGLLRRSQFAECPGLFGDLKFFLDRDMGLALPNPVGELLANFGDGEVIDGPPPPPPPPPPPSCRKRKRSFPSYDLFDLDDSPAQHFVAKEAPYPLQFLVVPSFPHPLTQEHATVGALLSVPPVPAESGLTAPPPVDKGKEKLYKDYSFSDNGIMSQKALKILNSKELVKFADTFGMEVINLDAPVGRGLYAKDLLHHAVNGTLKEVSSMLAGDRVDHGNLMELHLPQLMRLDQVLATMGFKGPNGIKMGSGESSKLHRFSFLFLAFDVGMLESVFGSFFLVSLATIMASIDLEQGEVMIGMVIIRG